MTVNNRNDRNDRNDRSVRTGSPAAPAAVPRLRPLPAVLLTWSRKRVATAIVVAAASAVFLLVATGIVADPAAGWAGYTAVTAAAILAGSLAGSYVGAPIGAAATFCDLRWPVAGLFGVIWANSPREAQPPAQVAVGILALAVMVWALHARLRLERKATMAPQGENGELEVCTDCRPLFPAKPRPLR